MSAKAIFQLAGDRWLVEGVSAKALGSWARSVRARDLRRPPDVTVHVACENSPIRPPELGASSEGAYRLSAEGFRAEISPDLAEIEVRGERASLAHGVRSVARLAGLLRCVADARGLALHASAVAWGNRALVLAGPTGAGKTTAAGAASRTLGASVFADDLVFLRRDKDSPKWRASGLPWEADEEARRRPRPIRAAALAAIRPGKAFALTRLKGARAAAAALASPPEALGVETGRLILAAARLADELPAFRAELPAGEEAVKRLLEETCPEASSKAGA